MLIAALSGRALAASARCAGYVPLVADLFNDLDTRMLASRSRIVAGSLARGFAKSSLLSTLDRLSESHHVIGVVYGSGFEDRPKLLQAIADRHQLIGNVPSVVSLVKDPALFAAICERNGIRHPTAQGRPGDDGTWLRKTAGASGGGHVVPAVTRRPAGRRRYYQRQVAGTPISAAFLADGRTCRVLGFSRQWSDPAPGSPFRYGGAVRPADITPDMMAEMAGAVARLVAETGLRGLNGADFVVRDDGFDLLEVNPRPGATLDIYDDPRAKIFDLHVAACAGRLPEAQPSFAGAAAAAVVYTRHSVTLPRDFVWPEWTADRQPPERAVPAGAPICTVLAGSATADSAERLAHARRAEILTMVGDTA